ncbi:MAG: hypothetical protein QXU40_03050 [Candidatus Pacearchaeota archaeon]
MSTLVKVINSLIVLVGPVILVLNQYWNILIPEGFGELLTALLQALLNLLGFVVTMFVSVPKALEMRPRWIDKVLRRQ